jgi:peptide/nickel transport system ATP-binding protein
MSDTGVVAVENLTIGIPSGLILDEVTLSISPGEILGIVGESGSGKSTLGLALLGYTKSPALVRSGSVTVAQHDVLGSPVKALRMLRGRVISYVPQDPSVALNPSARVGALVGEVVRAHRPDLDVTDAVSEVLEAVGLPTAEPFTRRYPHQLSGGQRQRLAIAMAIVSEPAVVVFDEPTTGLDVVTQARILAKIKRLRAERGTSMIYISHDLAVVRTVADRVAVMYAGRIVEEASATDAIRRPLHPYTAGLVASVPDHVTPRRLQGIEGVAVSVADRPPGCAFAPRCALAEDRCRRVTPILEPVADDRQVRCLRWAYTERPIIEPRTTWARGDQEAVLEVEELCAGYRQADGEIIAARDVSFALQKGECLALLGESGSGKTTIARSIVGLHIPTAGRVILDGRELPRRAKERTREMRRCLQIVFQNPYDSLNPRETVIDAVAWAARQLRGLGRQQAAAEAAAMLARVRLPPTIARRFPRELSGGERQRVAIARALVARPDVLVCDEITSSLDVSVQASVVELLGELRAELGQAILWISHDLGVVASVADRVIVLDKGTICEAGTVTDVLLAPSVDYTRRLLDAAPRLSTDAAPPHAPDVDGRVSTRVDDNESRRLPL